jgi:predicted ATPase
MRIDYLKIDNFKSLQNFTIDFEDSEPDKFRPTVIVGENGTGKTNLLEALVTIFRDLDLNDRTEFAYSIKYECRRHQIFINYDLGKAPEISVDDENQTRTRFLSQKDEYLPRHVFCYYSGTNPRLERLFFKHQRQHYERFIYKYESLSEAERQNLGFRRLFYAQTVHSQFVLLSFFADEDEKARDFLRENFGILGLESVLFVLHRPDWAKGKKDKREAKGKEGERFWRSRGVVKDFLERLYGQSLAPLALDKVPIQRNFRRPDIEDLLHLYLPDQESLQNLTKVHYPTQRQFFEALESTYISDLLEEVRIQLKSNRSDKPISFSELSEGEQQLLTVFGLLRFTKQEDSLILLDEPDTHINPVWGWQYFSLLEKAVEPAQQSHSHFIMVTHDPLVISSLEREQVQILRRDPQSNISAEMPDESPQGMGFAGILTSEIFGLRAAVDEPTLELLDKKRELARKPDLTSKEREELRDLREKTKELRLDYDERDPEFRRFLEASEENSRYQELSSKDTLSKEEIDELKQLAQEVMRKLDQPPQGGPR